MSDGGPDPDRGRLFLITGTDAEQRGALAVALTRRLGHAVVVDGAALERLVRVEALEPWTGPPSSEQLRDRLLRWSAALAVAETHQLEGYDAVLVEEALGDRLEDLLDLVDPEPVHVVVIGDGVDPTTPRWGLWVEGTASADTVAETILARLDEAVVVTADPD
jgi:hypothetical protein